MQQKEYGRWIGQQERIKISCCNSVNWDKNVVILSKDPLIIRESCIHEEKKNSQAEKLNSQTIKSEITKWGQICI